MKNKIIKTISTVTHYGPYIKIIKYAKPILSGYKSSLSSGGGRKKTTNLRRPDKIRDSKNSLKQLIHENLGNNDLFITLTCKDALKDLVKAKKMVSKFIEKFNTKRKRNGINRLRYVYVPEFQDKTREGSIHFHFIFFGAGSIPYDCLKTLWKYGAINVKKIADTKASKDRITNYMLKHLDDPRLVGSNPYGRSRKNLKEPLKIKIKTPEEVVVLQESLKDNEVFYTKFENEYRGKGTVTIYDTTKSLN